MANQSVKKSCKTAVLLEVLIASPSDVEDERLIIREAICSWNETNGREEGVILLPVMWENHSFPQAGKRPQEIINKQLVERSDLLIGVFWTRIGTDTGQAVSGTVEEIQQFLHDDRPVMLYFSKKPVELDSVDADQYQTLIEFKKHICVNALIKEYGTLEEFEKHLNRDLTAMVRDYKVNHFSEEKYITSTEPSSGTNISSNVEIILKEELKPLYAEWNAERDSLPNSIDEGKSLLQMLGKILLRIRVQFEENLTTEVLKQIDELSRMCKAANKHMLFLDGGISYDEFWELGNELFKQVFSVIDSIKI